MATVKLVLERSRALKNGSYPLVIQIIHRRTKRLIYTPFRLTESEFNLKKRRVIFISNDIKSLVEVAFINRKVKLQLGAIESCILELDRRCKEYVVSDIISRYRIETDSLSLMAYYDLLIERKLRLGKLGTAKSYQSSRASIAKFLNFRHIQISEVSVEIVREYEQYLVRSKISTNTLYNYIQIFKSVYNQAVTDGYPLPEKYPFRYIKVKTETTIKRALDRNSLLRLRDLDLKGREILELARDLFLFSFYSRGMAIVDMHYLRHQDIEGGVIIYRRQKTNQQLEITLTKELCDIIDKYRGSGDYVFPILRGSDPQVLYRQSRISLERTNRQLKEIGAILKLETTLTSYVARHSWATEAKVCGVPTSVISEGLGHTSEKTTLIYLKAFDRSVLDKVNRKIATLSKKPKI